MVPLLHSFLYPRSVSCDFSHQEVESIFHHLTWGRDFDFQPKMCNRGDAVAILSLGLQSPCTLIFLQSSHFHENKPGNKNKNILLEDEGPLGEEPSQPKPP